MNYTAHASDSQQVPNATQRPSMIHIHSRLTNTQSQQSQLPPLQPQQSQQYQQPQQSEQTYPQPTIEFGVPTDPAERAQYYLDALSKDIEATSITTLTRLISDNKVLQFSTQRLSMGANKSSVAASSRTGTLDSNAPRRTRMSSTSQYPPPPPNPLHRLTTTNPSARSGSSNPQQFETRERNRQY